MRGEFIGVWSETWRVWFPEGKSDPQICFVFIAPLSGEYWDQSDVKGLKFLFDVASALVQGEKPQPDHNQNAKVAL